MESSALSEILETVSWVPRFVKTASLLRILGGFSSGFYSGFMVFYSVLPFIFVVVLG